MNATVLEAPLLAAANRGGAGLRAAEYFTTLGGLVPWGAHRVKMAAGLAIGSVAGQTVVNVTTGRHRDSSEVRREDVILPLRPLHHTIDVNAYADDPGNRWKGVGLAFIPAITGGLGVLAASRLHFAGQINEARQFEDLIYGIGKNGKAVDKLKDLTFAQLEPALSVKQAESLENLAAASSIFGSASGMGMTPLAYHDMLNSVFAKRAGKMAGMGTRFGHWLTGTTAVSPHNHAGNMTEAWKHLLSHPEAGKNELHNLENLGGGALKGFIKNVTDAHIPAWTDELISQRDEVLRKLRAGEEAQAEQGKPGKFDKSGRPVLSADLLKECAAESWKRAEKFGIRHGLIDMTSPETVKESLNIRHTGFIGKSAEGTNKRVKQEADALCQNMERVTYQRNLDYAKDVHAGVIPAAENVEIKAPGAALDPNARNTPNALHIDKPVIDRTGQYIAAGAGLSGAVGLAAYAAHRGDEEERDRQRHNGTTTKRSRLAGAINGAPLSFLEWTGKAFQLPPCLHRLESAAFSSAGMYAGVKVGEALTGYTLGGKKVGRDEVIAPLKLIYEKMPYTDFHGMDSQNRWLKVGQAGLTMVGGAYGIVKGSEFYFKAQNERYRDAEYIDDVSRKIGLAQAKPWRLIGALSAMTNVGVGLSFLPIVSFGSANGNGFGLAADRRVVMPGMKEIWSNNHSSYPLGPASLRDMMINYAVHNPDREPRQLDDMARAILKAWFGEQPDTRVRQFTDDVLAVRNKYWKEGGIPKAEMNACKKDLKVRFTHQGLHDEIAHLGLDVLDAKLDDGGLSSDIADHMGAHKAVAKIIETFHQTEKARRENRLLPAPTNDNEKIANDNDVPNGENIPGHAERILRGRERQQGTGLAIG